MSALRSAALRIAAHPVLAIWIFFALFPFIVPNRTMANANIINISTRPSIKTVVNIGVTYDLATVQVERALKILEEVFRGHPKTAELQITFNKFDASALNLQVVHVWGATDWKEYSAAFQGMYLEVKRRFDAEKIAFAFPSQTVYLRQG